MQIFKYANITIYKCGNILIYKYAYMHIQLYANLVYANQKSQYGLNFFVMLRIFLLRKKKIVAEISEMVEDGADRHSSNTIHSSLTVPSQFPHSFHNRSQFSTRIDSRSLTPTISLLYQSVFELCRSASFSVDCSSLRQELL